MCLRHRGPERQRGESRDGGSPQSLCGRHSRESLEGKGLDARPAGLAERGGDDQRQIYVPGGLNAYANPTKSLFVYNPGSNTWVKKAPMPIASFGGAAAAINGKLYVVTPWGTSLYLHRYDPATNIWTARATGPTGHHYPVVGAINGKLYVAGTMSHDGYSSLAVSMYDPATNQWTSRAAMPNPEQMGASGRAINDKLYVVGGFEDQDVNGGTTSSLHVYDPATDSWTHKADMPSPRGFLSAAAANGVLYAIGGLAAPNVLGTNQAYSP